MAVPGDQEEEVAGEDAAAPVALERRMDLPEETAPMGALDGMVRKVEVEASL